MPAEQHPQFKVIRGISLPEDEGSSKRIGFYAERLLRQVSQGIDIITPEQRKQAENVKRFLDSPLRAQQRIHPVEGQPMPHFSLIDHQNRDSVLEISGSYSVSAVNEEMVMSDLADTRAVMGFISGEDGPFPLVLESAIRFADALYHHFGREVATQIAGSDYIGRRRTMRIG